MKGERLARVVGLVARNLLEILTKEPLQLRLQGLCVSARVAEDLEPALVVEEREEKVLDGHVGMPPRDRLPHGGLQREVQLATDLAHSFSTPARSG